MKDLPRLKELLASATKGTWTNVDEKRGKKKQVWIAQSAREVEYGGVNYPRREEVANFLDDNGKANADLAIAAVNALPDLIEEIERLRDALRDVYVCTGPGADMSWGCIHCHTVAGQALDD